MDNNFYINRFSSPVITGIPVDVPVKPEEPKSSEDRNDFKRILQEQINSVSDVSFSKHAVNRVMERNINISQGSLTRLNEGVKLAEEKGLNEPLILIDSAAYIVNVRNNTVITTVCNEDLKGKVFTNIDGTVII